MDVLSTFTIKIVIQKSEHAMAASKTSDHIQMKIKILNPSQDPKASSKSPNMELQDIDVLCTFIIRKESQNLDCGCTKDQWPYLNQYQDVKPQSGTSSVLQSPKSGLKGHGSSLHLLNKDIGLKFKLWMYQKPVTISKSRSRCLTPVRNLQSQPKLQIRS